jgi:hypothetical protein
MSNDLALSHLFCENHPSDAASILVRLPPEYVAGFFSSLSPAQGINLIQHMPTAYATQLLTYFEDDFSARLLTQADFATATRLLRPFNAQQRVPLMARMDDVQTAQLTAILNYSPGSVGNLVEIPAMTALHDWTVKHTQRELKKIQHRALFDFPVVDDEHRFLGLVSVHALLIAADTRRLDDLCMGKELALPAYATIASVINHPLWTNNLPSLKPISPARPAPVAKMCWHRSWPSPNCTGRRPPPSSRPSETKGHRNLKALEFSEQSHGQCHYHRRQCPQPFLHPPISG